MTSSSSNRFVPSFTLAWRSWNRAMSCWKPSKRLHLPTVACQTDRACDRVRAQVLNLLERLRSELSLTCLFIAGTVVSGVGVTGSAGWALRFLCWPA